MKGYKGAAIKTKIKRMEWALTSEDCSLD